MKYYIFITTFFLFFSQGTVRAQAVTAKVNIIPQPASLWQKEGVFVIDQNTALQFASDNKELQILAQYFLGATTTALLTNITNTHLPQEEWKMFLKFLALLIRSSAEEQFRSYDSILHL